jgi:hypothetical protein
MVRARSRGPLVVTSKLFIEKDSVGSARIAASRAANILLQDLVASSQKNGTDMSFIDARVISEATSLQCWLNAMEATSATKYDLQRALIMDPTNPIARHSICQ